MFGYRVPAPDEAMLISGSRCAQKGAPFRVVTGHGAVVAFKVGNDPESIINAGRRFLSDQQQMPVLTGRIFAGHLRSSISSMTVEEIVAERQRPAIQRQAKIAQAQADQQAVTEQQQDPEGPP